MAFASYAVNEEGRRAAVCFKRFTDEVTLKQAVALSGYGRFVVLDDNKVQHFASDDRESNGAYPPRGEY